MRVVISFPPLAGSGVPLLGQNRQFQWFHNPSYIYPMVPASAATLLHQDGFQVLWNDAIAENWTYAQFLNFFANEKPDLIAMETKTPVVKQHWRIIKELKEISPKTKTVLMGDHVTALPAESMERSPVDYVLSGGDYDFSLLGIARHLATGQDLPKGVWYRKNGVVQNTGHFELLGNLNNLPFIDRNLTKWHLYGEHIFKRKPATYTTAGRDCWYGKCTFCSWPTLFPRFRVRSPQSLLDEIGLLTEHFGIKEIFDDTGTFPGGGWLEKFCRGMIERQYNEKVRISINERVGFLSRAQYNLMAEAGFRVLKFGVESANQATLDRIDKGSTVNDVRTSCRMAKEAGLEVHLTIMVGYPWETKEDALKTLDLAKGLMADGYADMLQATIVIPYPGSRLFNECHQEGWLLTYDWDKYDMTQPVMYSPIPAEELMGLTRALYTSFLTPRFILRKILSVRDVDDLKFFYRGGKAVLGHLKDFARSSVKT